MYEVHLNEITFRKSGRLGLDQVIIDKDVTCIT